MVTFKYKGAYDLNDLIQLIALLRGPGGCPWDQEQTHSSNRRNFLEEAYEAAEAFDRDDPALMCEELGDMLMQVLFNIRMEEEQGRFGLAEVTDGVCKKLIFRHPHVFGSDKADTSDEVLVHWEERKRQEKHFTHPSDALDAVARSLSALWRADKLQNKAERVGFEEKHFEDALVRLSEQEKRFSAAVPGGSDAEEQLGALLFAAVRAGRLAGLDPEQALHRYCERYISSFRQVEEQLLAEGRSWQEASAEEISARRKQTEEK